MKPTQLKLPIGAGTSRQFEPVGFVAEGAARFAAEHGRTYSQRGLDTMQVNPRRGHAQSVAYHEAQAAPAERPGIRDAYTHMRSEVGEQYDFMTRPPERGGLGIKVDTTDSDPYPSPQAMAADVAQNRHISVFSTKQTGGHEFFTDEENDHFRAVHDVFGHAGVGRGFTRNGEEAAYISHAQMFSPEARRALASETRGQNSYLNFGPEHEFPNQGPGSKLVGLPDFATEPTPALHLNSKQFKSEPGNRQLRMPL